MPWDRLPRQSCGSPGPEGPSRLISATERVATASDDKTPRIWDAPPAVGQALLDQVRATLGPNAPEPLKFPD
jgi:hypothetical protein